MPTARCAVSFTDSDGIIHEARVQAESLYEAVALAIADFRQDKLIPVLPASSTEFTVAIEPPRIEHRIRLSQIEKWARSNTTCEGPAGIAKRQRIRTLLGNVQPQQRNLLLLHRCYHSGNIRVFMSDRSKIEWTDATWNPLRGCTKISPGCKHCYAETFAERFRGVPGHPYEQGFDLRLVPEKLSEPFNWSSPRTVFVNSMSDLFQPEVPDEYVVDVTKVMDEANWHTYQVLTKRSERLRDMLSGPLRFAAHKRHIWWGVSVENKRYGLPRIEHLRAAPAAIKFLSIEPLLEDLGDVDISGIHWAIVGGESGNGARPMQEPWVENILRLCRKERVAFFFKQWGGVRKGTAGRRLNNRTYDEMPMPQTHPIPARQIRSSAATAWDARAKRWGRNPLTQIETLDLNEVAV